MFPLKDVGKAPDKSKFSHVSTEFRRDVDKLASPSYKVKAHESLINCIDGAGGIGSEFGPPEVATGGRDGERELNSLGKHPVNSHASPFFETGQVKIWDTRQQSSPVARFGPKAGEPVRDVWAVAFGRF